MIENQELTTPRSRKRKSLNRGDVTNDQIVSETIVAKSTIAKMSADLKVKDSEGMKN